MSARIPSSISLNRISTGCATMTRAPGLIASISVVMIFASSSLLIGSIVDLSPFALRFVVNVKVAIAGGIGSVAISALPIREKTCVTSGTRL